MGQLWDAEPLATVRNESQTAWELFEQAENLLEWIEESQNAPE